MGLPLFPLGAYISQVDSNIGRLRNMFAPLRVSASACVACVAALGAAAFGMARPDGLIERSYSTAFDQQEPIISRTASALAFDPAHLHLSQLASPIGLGPTIAIGDRITLAQRSGEAASFEVLDVRPLSATALGTTTAELPRLLVVTAVASGQLPLQTIRFLVDAEARVTPLAAPKPRAL